MKILKYISSIYINIYRIFLAIFFSPNFIVIGIVEGNSPSKPHNFRMICLEKLLYRLFYMTVVDPFAQLQFSRSNLL